MRMRLLYMDLLCKRGFFFNINNDIIMIMNTIIRKTDENKIDYDAIKEAGEILKNGGLVAFPTETVYGLGANALDEKAAMKTYAAKGRPSDNPLIVHIASYDALFGITEDIPDCTKKLADKFWPGPLTMIFKKGDSVPYGTTGGLDTVAVRMPSDPIAAALIEAAGGYVSAPSANTSGRPSPTTAQHVEEDLSGKIEMIIDGGTVDIGLESTILDMTVEPPMILRPGAITKEMFEEVIDEVTIDKTILDSTSKEKPKAPGMKYRHYAPKAELKIVEGSLIEEVGAIRQLAHKAKLDGRKIGIIATNETEKFYEYGIVKNIGTRENEKTIARNLYGVLREFDDEDVDEIYSESFAVTGIGSAIMNRLEKAAGHVRLDAGSIYRQQKYHKILFLSNTDTSRGVMCAQILKNMDLQDYYFIDSRGMVVLFEEPVNQKAEAVMISNKLEVSSHMSQQINAEDIDENTLVLTMDESIKERIIAEYGDTNNIFTLCEYVDVCVEIPNPYGKALQSYGECYEVLVRLMNKLADTLNDLKGEYENV